jgi:hypothetical protein
MRSRALSIFLLLCLVAVLSVGVSLVILQMKRPPDFSDPYQFDLWLHKQIGISEAQQSAMEQDELAFHNRKMELVRKIQDLNGQLARAIREDKADSERVQRIIDETQEAQRELKKLTIRHVFDMQKHLEPEQYERLLDLTADALAPENAPESGGR